MRKIIGVLICALLIFSLTGFVYADLSWEVKSSMPTARLLPVAEEVDGKIYVIGGQIGSTPLQVVERYDPSTDSWNTNFSPYPVSGITGYASAVIDHNIYIIGGNPHPYPRVYMYNTDNNLWTKVSDLPAADRAMRAAVIDGYIYVFGGAGHGGSGTPFYKAVYKYDPDNNSWTTLPDMPSERVGYALGVIEGKAYIAGGMSGQYGTVPSTSLLRCDDPENGVYTELEPMPENRAYPDGEVVGNDFYVIGGDVGNNWVSQRDVFIYSATSDSWTEGPMLNYARFGAASAVVDGVIYVFGGRDENGIDLSSVESLQPNQPPVANAGPDQSVEQESYSGTEVTLDGSLSTDLDSSPATNDDIVSFDWYEGDTLLGGGEIITYTFPLGTHTVTLLVMDSYGETDEDEVIVTVEDTTPPEVTVSITEDSLWPPNHKMVDVGFSFDVSDICDPDPVVSIEVTSDEPTATAPGAGGSKHAPDAEITDDGRVLLRAERSGQGDGRVYVIKVTATDASGLSSSSSVSVKVNHNKKKEAIDSGQNYDATEIN